jgi:hypothetical protein
MVHSAEFNKRRRDLYHEGRLRGLKPRVAGHLYNSEDAERKIRSYLSEKPSRVNVLDSPAQRDEMRRLGEFLAAKRVDKYRSRNRYGGYSRVIVHVRDPDTGIRGKRYITVTRVSSNVPTRAAIVDEVRAILDANEGAYPEEVTGFTVDSFESIPDTTQSPSPPLEREGYGAPSPPPPGPGPLAGAVGELAGFAKAVEDTAADAVRDVIDVVTGGPSESAQEEPEANGEPEDEDEE